MKIKTHLEDISARVLDALDTSKAELLTILKELLCDVKVITQSDFNFWEKQLMENESKEIPVTKCGVENSKILWTNFKPKTINELASSFNSLLLSLLTYSNGEICEFQADYHWFVHIPTQKVFKESELGNTVGLDVEITDFDEIRIARVSELEIPEEELYQ